MNCKKTLLHIGSVICAMALANPAAAERENNVGSTLAAVALQHRAIKHNPFERPTLTQRKAPLAIEEPVVVEQTLLKLRAVLYSPESPMVNIDGNILQLGDEIDGFFLQEVSEDAAILSRGDVRIMLSMSQPQTTDAPTGNNNNGQDGRTRQ